jgi:hypothetical protein
MPIAPEELRRAADDMIRFVRAEIILIVPGNVAAVFRVNGPIENLAIMAEVLRSGINELQVAG